MKINELKEDYKNDDFKTFVLEDILEASQDYDGETEEARVLARLDDVAHGLQTGVVSSLIYTSDCENMFKQYALEVVNIVMDYEEETGSHLQNRNGLPHAVFMIWAAYEIVASDVAYKLSDEE